MLRKNIKLDRASMELISLFNSISGAIIKDCVVEDDRIIFVVEKGNMGVAIGIKAKNLEKLRTLFKKSVKFVEIDDDKKKFIENLCKPYEINKIEIEGNDSSSIVKIEVNPRDKSKLIGKGGKNINMIRKLARRHHPIKDVQII